MPPPPFALAKLEIGDRLPEGVLANERGQGVVFHRERFGGRPLVLFLSRDLCAPEAKRHLTALQAIADEAQSLDSAIFAVSSRMPAEHLSLVEELGLSFHLLSDKGNQLGGMLGFKAGGAPLTVLLDPNLRLLAEIGPAEIADHAGEALAKLKAFRAAESETVIGVQAPVLLMPRVLPPELCASLIKRWEREPHLDNLVSKAKADAPIPDDYYKIREDIFMNYEEPDTTQVMGLLARRLFPEIKRVFHFEVTRVETIRIGGYDAKAGGRFKRHRDNHSRQTAHRRFAMSLNLNEGSFEGGGVRFPEYGPQLYVPPTGAALVFSCGLLHEALPVTKGVRLGMFAFFFGEAEEALRQRIEAENAQQAKAGQKERREG